MATKTKKTPAATAKKPSARSTKPTRAAQAVALPAADQHQDDPDQPDSFLDPGAEMQIETDGENAIYQERRPRRWGSPETSGGDVDAAWERGDVGDEAPGGSVSTPDQDEVDELGEALGVTYQDNEELYLGEKEEGRDKNRWELDPASAEDYGERVLDEEDEEE